MKKIIVIVLILFVSCICFSDDIDNSTKLNTNTSCPEDQINIPHALLRGTTNILTFWMEIPRDLVLESNYNPGYGLVVGLVKGAYYGGTRVFYSIIDIGMLGFTGPNGYSKKFPEYVWQSKWNPWPRDNSGETNYEYITDVSHQIDPMPNSQSLKKTKIEVDSKVSSELLPVKVNSTTGWENTTPNNSSS